MKKSFAIYKSSRKENCTQSGFTVLEVAVVVVVSGILLAFLGSALLAFITESQIRTTEHRLQKIVEATDRYLSVNGRYPCPASRFLDGANSDFGRDSCATGTLSGTVRTGNLHVGAVPTRTLNLPDEFLADAWGRKYTYAVSRDLTSATTYRADLGIIRVLGIAGAVLTNTAHYVVLSHGRTGDGAYSLAASTARYVPCPANSQDEENCNDDRTFASMLVNNEPNIADFYDDYISYRVLRAPLTYPAGTIMAFDMTACPDGWIDFVSAEGRFVVGALDDPATGGIQTFDQEIMRLDPATPSANLDFTSGTFQNSNAVTMETNIPPYVALKYCEKLPR